MSNDLVLSNLPKGSVDKISRLVHEGIRRYGSGDKTVSTTPNTVIQSQNDDPLKVLKLRYAKGEISTEEFEEKKRLLE
ncbi:MAG: SHOCT domain-containing protein [Dehalococcoidia bacterium]|nr:MAG: SHOCT domain-containing protein [Dehalococcoidia bacterium]